MIILDLALVIIFGLLGGIIARKLRQPVVIGYLLAGIFASFLTGFFPASWGILQKTEVIDATAQIGIAFLLFTLGIEFSFRRLGYVVKTAVIGGVIQIFVSLFVYRFLLLFWGFSSAESFIMAAAFSLSSTAVVIKILNEKGLRQTLAGEMMVTWLLVQDLAVVPMLLILPTLKSELNGTTAVLNIVLPLLKTGLLLAGVILVGRKISAFLLKKVASLNNREILLLTTVTLALVAALLTQAIGLSFVLGAFLAGVLVAETTETHAIFSEIRPLRDLFTVVFFVSLGLLLPYQLLLANFGLALELSLMVILVKFILILLITFYFGFHGKVSLMVAIGLVQVGEFAFVIAREGWLIGLVGERSYSLILAVSVITIILTPFLFSLVPKFYFLFRKIVKRTFPSLYLRLFPQFAPGLEAAAVENLDSHVVLCGFGRMGRYIGRALESASIPYVVIEVDRHMVSQLQESGIKVLYGDPVDADILELAKTAKARLLIVAVPDFESQQLIITNAQTLNKNIKIISRTHFENQQKLLKNLGASLVIQPEFSAAVDVVERVLKMFGLDEEVLAGKIKRLKIEHGME